VNVVTAPVVEAEVPVTLRLSGTLRGNQEADLAANAMGRVIKTSVERGDRVKRGQVLVELDARDAALSASQARAEVESARVQEEQAKIECARYEQLRAKGAVSDAEYQQRITQCRALPFAVQAASARANLAAKNVGDGKIRAPFDGVVSERYAEVGQYVRHDSRVVSLISLDELRLEFAVPEADIAKVRTEQQVEFRVAAFPDRTFGAKIRYVAGALRESTRDLVVEAMVDNRDGLLKSGMFADVGVITGQRKLPSVPRASIVERDGQPHAFFVAGELVEERILSLGPAAGDRVGVLKGAKLGDLIATGDISGLKNGQRASAKTAGN
jgi:membrane fusion protein, multidrug efflux system